MGLPGKSILRYYYQENMTSQRPFLLLRISFPGRAILYNSSLDADHRLQQLPELAALDARHLVAPLGVDGALDVLHVWKSNQPITPALHTGYMVMVIGYMVKSHIWYILSKVGSFINSLIRLIGYMLFCQYGQFWLDKTVDHISRDMSKK